MYYYSSNYCLFRKTIFSLSCFAVIVKCSGLNDRYDLFKFEEEIEYTFDSTASIDDVKHYTSETVETDVGYQISGNLVLSAVWSNPSDASEKLLNVRIFALKLKSKTHKNASEIQFKKLKTNFNKYENQPFIIHWKNYTITEIYINKNEDSTLINLKKALSSLFQFQLKSGSSNENDVSGNCIVHYRPIDDKMIRKRVDKCSNSLPIRMHSKKMLGINATFTRDILYQFKDESLTYLSKITSYESNLIKVNLDESSAVMVTGILHLTIYATRKQTISQLNVQTIEEALNEIRENSNYKLSVETLSINSWYSADRSETKSLKKLIKEHHKYLLNKKIGTATSASSFIRLIKAFRNSTEDEILSVLMDKKNKAIVNQLYDLAGSAHTISSHKAIRRVIDFLTHDNLNYVERYLIALSLGCCPNEKILEDLIGIWKSELKNGKLEETLILTITSMVRKFNETDNVDQLIQTNVRKFMMNKMSDCQNDICKAMYLRAFRNIPHQDIVPLLTDYASTGSRLISVVALKALYHFPKHYWNSDVLKICDKIYHQKVRKYDSSARAIAADILLESTPDAKIITDMLLSIKSFDPAYEIKRYVLQRIQQISSMDENYYKLVQPLLNINGLNNYNFLAQKGLSNALSTKFFRYSDLDVVLHSINEVYNGIIKRSIMNVVVEKEADDFYLFSLETYSSGLSSFLWSDSTAEEDIDEPEETKAGIELALFGTQIRPYVFFTSTGELMGHIWSGTAAQRTSAFQAITLLHDHEQRIPLSSGHVVNYNFYSSTSFDLAGQIDISIWNRNAKSLIQTLAGVSIYGLVSVETPLFGSSIELDIASDLSLDLFSDLEFYDEMALCFRMVHPNLVLKRNVRRKEWTTNGEHNFNTSEENQLFIPGRTFALGRMNNKMCNLIFSK